MRDILTMYQGLNYVPFQDVTSGRVPLNFLVQHGQPSGQFTPIGILCTSAFQYLADIPAKNAESQCGIQSLAGSRIL
jgi:hypothetical protein